MTRRHPRSPRSKRWRRCSSIFTPVRMPASRCGTAAGAAATTAGAQGGSQHVVGTGAPAAMLLKTFSAPATADTRCTSSPTSSPRCARPRAAPRIPTAPSVAKATTCRAARVSPGARSAGAGAVQAGARSGAESSQGGAAAGANTALNTPRPGRARSEGSAIALRGPSRSFLVSQSASSQNAAAGSPGRRRCGSWAGGAGGVGRAAAGRDTRIRHGPRGGVDAGGGNARAPEARRAGGIARRAAC